MSKSIFHVRPRDTGKGWAIDEYDGRGAWQSTYGTSPEIEPMDKDQAQRRVFQLRRKALNSETVNKEGSGKQELAATAPPPATPDWVGLQRDVVERIQVLAATCSDKSNVPEELRGAIWRDLIVPNVRLLAEFCTNVQLEDVEEPEPLKDITGCDV